MYLGDDNMTWPSVIMGILFLTIGLLFTFLPLQTMKYMYKFVEILCIPLGEECREVLEQRYGTLGKDPQTYAQKHSVTVLIYRVMGIIILIIFVVFLKRAVGIN
jgi:hypothetical protein